MLQSQNVAINLQGGSVSQSPEALPITLHFLIVEDISEDVELIVLTLEESGIQFTYDQVEAAHDCIDALEEEVYHAVLSDYRLPQLTGLEVLRILKASRQQIPMILVTGSLGEEAAVDCIKSGMTDYVLKDRLFRLPTVLERALVEYTLRRQKEAAIAQIHQQAWQQAIIHQIVQAMRGTLVLDELLQTIVDHLHSALSLDRALIFRVNENKKTTVRYVSESSTQKESLVGQSCPFYHYLQNILRQGKPACLNQLASDLAPELLSSFQELSLKSILVVPLIYQNKYWGGISLHCCQEMRFWSESEVSLVQAVVDQCTVAIYQIQLYEQAQQELSERKRIEAQLRHDAFHDALTGLPNRALFFDRLSHALTIFHRRRTFSASTASYQFAVLFLDLDRFKVINDSLGHSVGDQLLVQLAQRLTGCTRAGDTVARLGGDEFVFLLEDITQTNKVIEIAERIQQQLKKSFLLRVSPFTQRDSVEREPQTNRQLPRQLDENSPQYREVFMTVSIGITLVTKDYHQPEQILRDADLAMYRAKNNGRGRYEIFDVAMHTQAFKQLQIENDLRRAIEHEELRVMYQPIFSLQTMQIEGFEALVRWQHPDQGFIAPDDFIPTAEETGLIKDIDLWVLKQACEQINIWKTQKKVPRQLTINVNFSGKQFAQSNLLAQIDDILEQTGLPGSCLKVEITESALIENAQLAQKILEDFKIRGFQVCLDDFGMGYSSLSSLHRFPIDVIKIDKSFIQKIQTVSDTQEIVKAIINLGGNLGLTVIAEGIETESQYAFTKEYGCHSGQGFWFSQPLAINAVTQFLDRHK